ncbi:MAG: hypothetical protein HEQ32_07440 [Vampirovibrio sp.]
MSDSYQPASPNNMRPTGRPPDPRYKTAPAGGNTPPKERSVLSAFAVGAASGGLVFTPMAVGQSALELWAPVTGLSLWKPKHFKDLTQSAQDHLGGKGLRTDTKALFKRPDSAKVVKQAGDFAQNAGALTKKSGTHLGGFLKGFWNTPGGKIILIPTTAVALLFGTMFATETHKSNEKLATLQARNPNGVRPTS